MKIAFYGGRQAGLVVLLALMARGEDIGLVFPEDEMVEACARRFRIEMIPKQYLNDAATMHRLRQKDIKLVICCHGRQRVGKSLLELGCINLHPCLYGYKGARPVDRLVQDRNTRASVGVHWMGDEIDEGEIIIEIYKEVVPDSVVSVYNQLYPVYAEAVMGAMDIIAEGG